MIRRILPPAADGIIWVTLDIDGQDLDVPLDDVPDEALFGYFRDGGLARDAAPIAANHAVGGLLDWLFGDDGAEGDDWQAEWRAKAHDWIRESQRRANVWLERQRQAEFAVQNNPVVQNLPGLARAQVEQLAPRVAEAAEWRRTHRRFQDWMYEVIDTALGGVETLGIPAVALPAFQWAIGGAVAVITVKEVARFFETDERKGAEYDERVIDIAEAMVASDDPELRQSGARLLEGVNVIREQRAKNEAGIGFGWLLGAGVVIAGFLAWCRRQQLAEHARDAMARVKRSRR